MQNGPAETSEIEPDSERVASTTDQASVLAGLEDITLTSSPATAVAENPDPTATSRARPHARTDCSLSARAYTVSNARARLTLKAPCHVLDHVDVHHSGLTFSAVTDKDGTLSLTIPAMSEYAIFLFSFADKKGTVATTHVPELKNFNRIALQWQGDTDIQLHALEFGAAYGQAGHVWSGSDAAGEGNTVHLGLGQTEAARNVEIYSFPAQSTQKTGSVELSVEAEVTATNCAKGLNVQALEWRGDQRLRSRDLMIDFPACDAVGDFLVLNNLFQDLTIAAK